MDALLTPATTEPAVPWRQSAVVLVAHGSSRRPAAAETVFRHGHALRRRGVFGQVREAFLHGTPSLQEVIAALDTARVYVVPLFMCPGRAVVRDLPMACARVQAAHGRSAPEVHLCPPIGAHPMMAGLILHEAERAVRRRGWSFPSTALLLIAHGSPRDPASNRTTQDLARRLRSAAVFNAVMSAFLDEPPTVAEQLARLPRPVVAIGLFAAPGGHARFDVPPQLDDHDTTAIAHIEAVGAADAIPEIILAVLKGYAKTLRPRALAR